MLIFAAGLFAIQQTLQSLRVIDIGGDELNVPIPARKLLKTAKTELRELAIASLRDQPADVNAAAAHLRDALLFPDVPETSYGGLTIDVTTHGDVIAVVATFAIPCGSDSALFLFRHADGGWKLVFDRERNGYDQISGAAGSLLFAVSQPDANDSVLVISSDVNPWCSSNWQMIRWRVDRIDRNHAVAVTHLDDTIFLGDDDVAVDATPNGFSIRYSTGSADTDRLVHKRTLHYEVDAQNHLTRIDPIASSPTDAVDDWLRVKHDDAMGSYEEPVRLRNGRWRVTLTTDEGFDRTFIVTEKDGSFRVISEK